MKTERIVAYSYLRFSLPRQALGDSERRQDDVFDEYCRKNNRIPGDLIMRDLGRSAFRGRNAVTGDLAAFLAAIESGKVKRGDELVIEDLDRLSRQPPLESLDLLRAIVRAGVTVVTPTTGQRYSEKSLNKDFSNLLLAMSSFWRGHNESMIKSVRVGQAWRQKKLHAATAPLTATTPTWLKLVRKDNDDVGKIVKVPDRVDIVRRAAKLATQGLGALAIIQKFRSEGIPAIGWSGKWTVSGMLSMLRSRSLIGEYQPHRGTEEGRVPDGQVIKGYYPAILSEDEFLLLQAAINSRKGAVRGGQTTGCPNLFGGLWRCAVDDSTMTMSHKDGGRILACCSEGERNGGTRHYCSYTDFEREFLMWVTEVKLDDALPDDRTEVLVAKLTAEEAKIAVHQKQIVDAGPDEDTSALGVTVHMLNVKANDWRAQLEAERAKNASAPFSDMQREAGNLAARMARLTGEERTVCRERIATSIRRLVKNVRVWMSGEPRKRLVLADVEFHDGKHRHFAYRADMPHHQFGTDRPGNYITTKEWTHIAKRLTDAFVEAEHIGSHDPWAGVPMAEPEPKRSKAGKR